MELTRSLTRAEYHEIWQEVKEEPLPDQPFYETSGLVDVEKTGPGVRDDLPISSVEAILKALKSWSHRQLVHDVKRYWKVSVRLEFLSDTQYQIARENMHTYTKSSR